MMKFSVCISCFMIWCIDKAAFTSLKDRNVFLVVIRHLPLPTVLVKGSGESNSWAY